MPWHEAYNRDRVGKWAPIQTTLYHTYIIYGFAYLLAKAKINIALKLLIVTLLTIWGVRYSLILT